jgi:hypothetical protein
MSAPPSLRTVWATRLHGCVGAVGAPGYEVDTIERVEYPAEIWPVSEPFSATAGESIAIGVSQLNDTIYSTQGEVFVVGGSLGAMVIDQELRNLETTPNPSAPEDILFVEASNPERPGGVLSYVPYGTRIPVLGNGVAARSANSL